MKITSGLAQYHRSTHPVLTIGNFDGHHLGHLALLRAVVELAEKRGGTPIVLTLDPHPVRVLAPDVELRLLTSMEEKLARCEQAGIHEVLLLEFTAQLAALSPDEFVLRILRDGVGVRDLFVGEHFAFGQNRSGSVADLRRLGPEAEFQVHSVPPVSLDGQVVSSTRIRKLIQLGDMQGAAKCLGRPYALGGTVVSGQRRGQDLGWPTANLAMPHERVIPPDGVYATTTTWKAERLDSVSYVGTSPTFGIGERLLEVYLLDQDVDLYGERIDVHFIERLRDDARFDSAEALAARISLDVTQARETLKTAAHGATDSSRGGAR